MAAFALRATSVILYAYTLSGVLLIPPVVIGLALRWRIERALVARMIGWGAAVLVAGAVFVDALG